MTTGNILDGMRGTFSKYMVFCALMVVCMSCGAAVSVVSFAASEPDEDGAVTIDWCLTGWQDPASTYPRMRYNVAISRTETDTLAASTNIVMFIGGYMDQRNSVKGSLVDTSPLAGTTNYYWINYAPYNASSYTYNFASRYLAGGAAGILNSSPCYGPVSVFVPLPKLTLEVSDVDWSEGRMVFLCKDESTGGEGHRYTLSYLEGETWIDVEGAMGIWGGGGAETVLEDVDFSNRLGGISTVKYKVRDENGRESDEIETRRRYALCVGITEYFNPDDPSDTSQNLEACAMDANGWYCKFQELGEFSVDIVTDAEATKGGILSRLATYAQLVEPGDIFVYTHSSHGVEDALCTHIDKKSEDITAAEFADALSSFRSGAGVVIILDTCYSGSMIRRSTGLAMASKIASVGKIVGQSFARSVLAAMNDMDASARNVLLQSSSAAQSGLRGDEIGWITATHASQLSIDGVFSQMCLQTAGWEYGRADSDKDGRVCFQELGDFAVDYLASVYADFEMTPQVISDGILANVCAGTMPKRLSYSPINEVPANVRISQDRIHEICVEWSSVQNATLYYVIFKVRSSNAGDEEVLDIRWPVQNGTSLVLQELEYDAEIQGEDGATEWVRRKRILQPGDSFDIHVRAYNPMYAGPASESRVGRTATDVISIDPRTPVPTPVIDDFVFSNFFGRGIVPVSPLNADGTVNYANLNIDHDGDGLSTLQECVSGSDPLDKSSTFSAQIRMKGGTPEITWTPKLSAEAEGNRRYVILGLKTLSETTDFASGWVDMNGVREEEKSQYHFFKVEVDFR